jgi:hypothetical protein
MVDGMTWHDGQSKHKEAKHEKGEKGGKKSTLKTPKVRT